MHFGYVFLGVKGRRGNGCRKYATKKQNEMPIFWHEVCRNTKIHNIMKQFVLIVLVAMMGFGSAEACLNKAKVENLEVKGESLEAKGELPISASPDLTSLERTVS